MKSIKKLYILLLKQLELGSAIAVRLTKITGKSKNPIHPKHFLSQKPWYLDFIKKSDIVVDLGSGNGQSAVKSAKIAKKVIGIEINPQQIKIAQDTAKRERLNNILFKVGNLEQKISFKDSTFNKAIFLDVLEHLKKREQALLEVKRVLNPDGLLILGVPNSQTTWKKFQRSVNVCSFSDPDHKIEFSEKSIKNILKKHGFEIIRFGYSPLDTPLRGIFDIVGGFSLSLYKKTVLWRQKKSTKNPKEAGGFEIVAINKK